MLFSPSLSSLRLFERSFVHAFSAAHTHTAEQVSYMTCSPCSSLLLPIELRKAFSAMLFLVVLASLVAFASTASAPLSHSGSPGANGGLSLVKPASVSSSRLKPAGSTSLGTVYVQTHEHLYLMSILKPPSDILPVGQTTIITTMSPIPA